MAAEPESRPEPQTRQAPAVVPAETIEAIERHFDALIEFQRGKVLRMARERRPGLTSDDILMAHDYPELMAWADYQFEDGILAGFIQAQISLRAKFFR